MKVYEEPMKGHATIYNRAGAACMCSMWSSLTSGCTKLARGTWCLQLIGLIDCEWSSITCRNSIICSNTYANEVIIMRDIGRNMLNEFSLFRSQKKLKLTIFYGLWEWNTTRTVGDVFFSSSASKVLKICKHKFIQWTIAITNKS